MCVKMPRCGCGHRLPSADSGAEDENSDDENMPSWIKFWEQEDRKFVSTRASKLVEDKLRNCNRVIILGETGCGKSAIALNIALKYRSRKWKVVMVKNIRDCSCERKLCFFFIINDPIGKTVLDEKSCRQWYLQKNLLNRYFSTKRQNEKKVKTPKVIVTCRSSLADEDVSYYFKQFSLINMDERGFELAKEEKEKILKKHTDCSQCTDADVDELLKTEKSFPLISELLSASKTFEGNILAFYREPFVEIKKEILSLKDISKEQCMCLFILNVCGNRLTKENFEEKEDDYKHIESIHDDRENGVVNNDRKSEKGNNEKDIEKSNDCNGERIDNYKNDNKNDNEDGKNNNDNYELDKQMINDLLKAFKLPESTSKRTLFESLNQFRGHYFVKRIKDIFQITNGSFLRALTHIFCTSFPAQFLKYCPSNFFRTLTTSTAQSDIIPKVQLQDNYINLFVDIIQEDIKTGTFLDVFLSPWIRDKSVLTNLLLRFESMPYEKMIELTLNSKLNAHLKIAKPKVRKQMTGFSRLDLIGLSKEVSPIILSLVLNLDDLYHAMFTLIRNNANGSKYLNNAPLMSACCVNGREDLARLVLDIANDRKRCWSKRENIYPMHIAANFLNTDILDLALVGEHDVNMTTRTMESPFFLAAAAGKYALQNIPWTLKQELSNSSKTYDELVEENRLKILTLLWQRGADVNIHPDKSSSALAYACQKGDIDTIQFMIKSGASVKETNDENFGALHFASEVGNIEIVQLLLCSGADINICTSKGLTPLYLASFNGHADVVDMFLSKGTTQVLKDKSECNPFFVACKHGHERIVEMFLEYDQFVHCKLPDNTSALLAAVDNGHKEIVELLLKNGADANIVQNNSKISPLYSASGSGYDGILELLLKPSESVDMETMNANIPLDIASQNGHHSIVQTLLENGANVNHYTLERKSPLFHATENGHYDIVMFLLQKKAELNSCTNKGRNPLMQASSCGYENIVRELLSHGANVNEADVEGSTALYLASENGHIDIAKVLLANKADASLCNDVGLTPLYIASRFGHHIIVQELLQKDTKICGTSSKNPLLAASYFGHYKTVDILLQNRANVNVQNDDGDTPLITASRKGWCEIVKILLKFEADVNLYNEDDENALHCACFMGHTDIVKILLDHGMDIDGHDEYTPLQQALFGERMTTALFLLDHVANANIVTYGTSALYLACDAGFKELMNILLELNADVNPKNPDNSPADSPLLAAIRNGSFYITKELLRHGANIIKTNRHGGQSLLAMAVENQNLGIVKLLIEYGANVNEQDEYGTTALHASAYYTDTLDFMTILLNNNANTNVRNYIGTTPLMMALHKNPETKERVQALLTHGADINARDNFGCLPLHSACKWPDEHDVIPYLLNNGADINAQDENGETALYVTSFYGFLENVKTLVRYGADINLHTSVGLSPLDISMQNGYTDIEKFLKQNMNEEKNKREKKISSKLENNSVSVSQREVVLVRQNALAPVLGRRNNSMKLQKTWQQRNF